jgi:acyl carrier protein
MRYRLQQAKAEDLYLSCASDSEPTGKGTSIDRNDKVGEFWNRHCVSPCREMLATRVVFHGGTHCTYNSLHRTLRTSWRSLDKATGRTQRFKRTSVEFMSTIAVEVITQIAATLNIEASAITPADSLARDLGADSLDTVSLVMALEDHFAIDLPDEDMQELGTVGQMIEYVELAVAMRAPVHNVRSQAAASQGT